MPKITKFFRAIERGDKNRIEILLNQLSVNACDADGNSALHCAVHYQQIDIIDLLLKKNANPCLFNQDGETALHWAIIKNTPIEVIRLLLEAQKNIRPDEAFFATQWHEMACVGHSEQFFENEEKFDSIDAAGFTPLHYAAARNHLPLVEFLLKRNVNVNIQSRYGSTAFMLAAQNGHRDIVDRLCDVGARVDLKNKWGFTALHLAVSHCDNQTMIKKLCQTKELLNLKNRDEETPLFEATSRGKNHAVETLLDCFADSELSDQQGRTPLYVACLQKNKTLVEIFTKYNVTLQGMALTLAIQNRHVRVVDSFYQLLSDSLGLVSHLNLSHTGLHNEGVSQLVKWFKSHPNLTELRLAHNHFDKKGAVELANLVKKQTSLMVLDVSQNPQLGNGGYWIDSGIQVLLKACAHHPQLKQLDLSHTNLNQRDLNSIKQLLTQNAILQSVDVSDNACIGWKEMFDTHNALKQEGHLGIIQRLNEKHHFIQRFLDQESHRPSLVWSEYQFSYNPYNWIDAEIASNIFRYMNTTDLLVLSQINKNWRRFSLYFLKQHPKWNETAYSAVRAINHYYHGYAATLLRVKPYACEITLPDIQERQYAFWEGYRQGIRDKNHDGNSLQLCQGLLDKAHLQEVRLGLPALPNLTDLNLSDNQLSHDAMPELLLWLKQLPSLKHLNLSGNPFGSRNFKDFGKAGIILLAETLRDFTQLKELHLGQCALSFSDVQLVAKQCMVLEALLILKDKEFSEEEIYRLAQWFAKKDIGQIRIEGKLLSEYRECDRVIVEDFIAELRLKLTCWQRGNECLTSGIVKRREKTPAAERALKVGKKLLKVLPLLKEVGHGVEALVQLGKIIKSIKQVKHAAALVSEIIHIEHIKQALLWLRYGEGGSPSEQTDYYARFFIGTEGGEKLEHFLECVRHHYGSVLVQCEVGQGKKIAEALFEHLKLGMLAMKCANISPGDAGNYLLRWLIEIDFFAGKVTLRQGKEVDIDTLFHQAGFKCQDHVGNTIAFDAFVEQAEARVLTQGQSYGYRVATEFEVMRLNGDVQLYEQTGSYREKFQVERSVLEGWRGKILRPIPMECRCQSVRFSQYEKRLEELEKKLNSKDSLKDHEILSLKKQVKALDDNLAKANIKIRYLENKLGIVVHPSPISQVRRNVENRFDRSENEFDGSHNSAKNFRRKSF